jgi:hypothetical protein
MASVTNNWEVFSVKEKEIPEIENEKRRLTFVGNLVSLNLMEAIALCDNREVYIFKS